MQRTKGPRRDAGLLSRRGRRRSDEPNPLSDSRLYMPVILGLVALGAHVNRGILRVLARLDEVR